MGPYHPVSIALTSKMRAWYYKIIEQRTYTKPIPQTFPVSYAYQAKEQLEENNA